MSPRLLSGLLLALALVAGTAADRPRPNPELTLGGYRVVAADFHVHSAMWSGAHISPWGLVLQAQRDGLDALSINGHNQVWDGKAARSFSRWMSGPTILTGQEIKAETGPHVVAIGTHSVVTGRGRGASEVIAEIHRQGGIAVAAHPFRSFWPAFDSEALGRLDGAEVCHPMVYSPGTAQGELEQFAARGRFAAIGSSDFHGVGRLGLCRTYVFARDGSAEAILDAIRERRTVVYGRGGKAYGDPSLVHLAERHPRLREAATLDVRAGPLAWTSRVAGVLGLLGLVLTGPPRRLRARRPTAP